MRAPKRKRSIRRRVAGPQPGMNLEELARRASYIGSPEHKDAPSFAGQPKPRADASICDRGLAEEQERVTEWLRTAIRMAQNGLKGWKRSMSDFAIDFEWIDPLAARGAELRATWARLVMAVDGYPLTRVLDQRSKTMRDAIYLPLYPFAEWLVEKWWSLWAEPDLSSSSDRAGYDTRHSLVHAREGYALPPVSIEPQTADVGERAFCECAGPLGLAPYDLDDAQREEIENTGNKLPEEIVPEFFRSARSALEDFKADAKEVMQAVEYARNNEVELAPLKSLARLVSSWKDSGARVPWEQGYWLARCLRTHLGLDGKPLKAIEDIEAVLGMGKNDLGKATGAFSSHSIPFSALVGINDKSSPTFVLRPSLPASARFHLFRALFEYLYAPMQRNALVTEASTERQKRNRAFAAELLAPSEALRHRIRTSVVTWERAEELAGEFGVSAFVIGHQLKNHGIADIKEE